MEYAPHGNLKDFLKQICRDSIATEQELMVFGVQIARGMHFLESKKCIHGDLAARNVLVGDNFIMKIADFGFSRYVKGTNGFPINPNNKLPIRWMSIETLEGKDYDSSCDVWSFGVVLWEILTLGEEPYLHTATTNLYNFLNMGNRLEKPPLCSNEMYVMMRQCWNSVPKQRPTFGELVRDLEYMCNNQGGNINAALQNEY
ncbi:tyrosine-protein kinase receptor Tie-1-like [Scaptodrosophila lebanonensis]|uniref:Tyrosine-protein kinase receptor Tie-1-like n=1 Tax=Drosophila lebanonensis TaxID=7225 RepID=A0A6J2T540_DROLE|nr:tyrosine-protein kinase receptor Tie-1-like [Scaptodrosophila lebanonensis]